MPVAIDPKIKSAGYDTANLVRGAGIGLGQLGTRLERGMQYLEIIGEIGGEQLFDKPIFPRAYRSSRTRADNETLFVIRTSSLAEQTRDGDIQRRCHLAQVGHARGGFVPLDLAKPADGPAKVLGEFDQGKPTRLAQCAQVCAQRQLLMDSVVAHLSASTGQNAAMKNSPIFSRSVKTASRARVFMQRLHVLERPGQLIAKTSGQVCDRRNEAVDLNVMRLASFSDAGAGGNPAGVCLLDALPDYEVMQAVAAQVGYSETAFACPDGPAWRVRYFSPETEVPFCGHATIALGAALAQTHGDATYALKLNEAEISVEGRFDGETGYAALMSPPTRSADVPPSVLNEALELFGLHPNDLDPALPPRLVHGGADHLALTLKNKAAVSAMRYSLAAGKALMLREGWVTIMLVYAETPALFHSRNAFASGGVYEDPATGAATAAFAGYLKDIDWPESGPLQFIQGEVMGARSRLHAGLPDVQGGAVRVAGEVRALP